MITRNIEILLLSFITLLSLGDLIRSSTFLVTTISDNDNLWTSRCHSCLLHYFLTMPELTLTSVFASLARNTNDI